MRNFFVNSSSIDEDKIKITDKNDIIHITKVLRLRSREKIKISDSTGWEYICEISEIHSDRIITVICDRQKNSTEPNLEVTLFQGIPKAGKLDDTVRKVTELGIHEIFPVFMARTVITDNGNYGKKVMRLQKIAVEASKQCKRGKIPQINDKIDFNTMLKKLECFDLNLFLYEDENNITLKNILNKADKDTKTVAIIIGPEGGFSEPEANALKEKAFSASLGKTILRTETAGVAALSMVMYALEMRE